MSGNNEEVMKSALLKETSLIEKVEYKASTQIKAELVADSDDP